MTIATLMGQIEDVYTADAANLTNVLLGHGVHVRETPWEHDQIHPGITIHYPNQEGEDPGANKLDDFLYPILATMVQGKSGSVDSINAAVDEFRDRSKRLFHNQRLAADDTVLRMTIKFGRVILPSKWRDEWIASQLAIVVKRRERRT